MYYKYKQKIITLTGKAGEKWFENLPSIIRHYEEKWSITALPPFDLSYNYVAPAKTSGGTEVVLKIGYPNSTEFADEIAALKFFDGKSAIKVLREDEAGKAALLEYAKPGSPLRSITDDSRLVSIAAETIKKLHKPIEQIQQPFSTIEKWVQAFDRYSPGPIPKQIFDKAKGLTTEYLQDKKEQVLLHGDLHSDNILESQRDWLVIDPKGVIGESEFELAAFLRNPIYDFPKGSNLEKLEARRINQFAEELGFDKQRILGWVFAGAVLSMVWFLEDEKVFKEIYLENAQLLDRIRF